MKIYKIEPGYIKRSKDLVQEMLDIYAQDYAYKQGWPYDEPKLDKIAKIPKYIQKIKTSLIWHKNSKLEKILKIIDPEQNKPKYCGDNDIITPYYQSYELNKEFNIADQIKPKLTNSEISFIQRLQQLKKVLEDL